MRKQVINREGKTFRKQSLEERIAAHPRLRARIESLLCVVENSTGDIERANDAEQRVIEELRQMGNDALHVWAENQKSKKEKEVNEKNKDINKHSKKNSIGTRPLE